MKTCYLKVAVAVMISVAVIISLTIIANRSQLIRRNSAKRECCLLNLKNIHQGLALFADDHEGIFPRDLSSLYYWYVSCTKLFVCPASSRPDRVYLADFLIEGNLPFDVCYIYNPALTREYPRDCLLVYDRVQNHSGTGRNACFADGQVRWIPTVDGPSVLNVSTSKVKYSFASLPRHRARAWLPVIVVDQSAAQIGKFDGFRLTPDCDITCRAIIEPTQHAPRFEYDQYDKKGRLIRIDNDRIDIDYRKGDWASKAETTATLHGVGSDTHKIVIRWRHFGLPSEN